MKHRAASGFSLVEVTVAIGIVSFALLAVVGLLPVGLKSIKSATEQSAAANTLTALAESLRSAQSTDGTNYSFAFGGSTKDFKLGETNLPPWTWTNLDLGGATNTANRRIAARLEIRETPSADGSTPGRASVSVAWSAHPGLTYGTNGRWENADGQMVSGLQFYVGRRP